MSSSPTSFLDRAADAGDLETIAFRGIGGTLLSIATVVIDVILTGGRVVLEPMSALAEGLADLTLAFFGGPADIILAGVDATAASLLGRFNVGPLTFALAIASVLAGLYVIAVYRDEEDTGNLIPGLPFDVPVIGEQEEDED